jgi:hypothetical protein
VKKLEDEIQTIKETSKEILHKLESSIFSSLPAKLSKAGKSVYETILHVSNASNTQLLTVSWSRGHQLLSCHLLIPPSLSLSLSLCLSLSLSLSLSLWRRVVFAQYGSNTASVVQKEYPKWLSLAQKYAQDLPAHATSAATLLQREGTKQYINSNKLLSSFLAQQGVPQQYIQYISLGVIALLVLVAALITFSILSLLLGFLCRCGSRKNNATTRKKAEKRVGQQHKEYERKLDQEKKVQQ